MLLTREHMQAMVNKKAATPFAQRNFLSTLRAGRGERRVPDDLTLAPETARHHRRFAEQPSQFSTDELWEAV
jgi:hypothetical protein